MPTSTDVTLPRDCTARFPDRCIVCEEAPDSTVRVTLSSQLPIVAFLFPILVLFGRIRVTVPACHGCKSRFRFQRWGRELALVVCLLIVYLPLRPHLPPISEGLGMLVTVGLAFGLVTPFVLLDVFRPRFFDFTRDSGTICYEFVSREYARAFHRLNRDAVVRSDILNGGV